MPVTLTGVVTEKVCSENEKAQAPSRKRKDDCCVANMFGFREATYFVVPEGETATPKVDLR